MNSRTCPESKRKLPCRFGAAFFRTVFRVLKKKLCAVLKFVFAKKLFQTLQPAQVALAKMPRNEAKIYQETDFLSTEAFSFVAFYL